jgi:hypothetical protein
LETWLKLTSDAEAFQEIKAVIIWLGCSQCFFFSPTNFVGFFLTKKK